MGFSCADTFRLGLGYVLLGASSIAAGQAAANAPLPVASRQAPRILRELRDPATGAHWLVLSNDETPAGPGRLVPATAARRDRELRASNERTAPVGVIQPGDRVVIEEHTPAADAYLEATAVDQAPAGRCFRARMKIGGKVVRAVALAPGRAALMPALTPGAEARP
jgi:hypothetical protein